jgi:protoheme IX farnesyltransferase
VLFLWQFPHFMAIAWMYREDYDRAGYLVLPQGKTRTGIVKLQTVLPLFILLPMTLVPAFTGHASMAFSIGALLLGLGFLYYGTQFTLHRTNSAARRLLAASIIYLPLLFLLMVLPKF